MGIRQEAKDTYTVKIECSNCDYNGSIELLKGHPATGSLLCSNCGCRTAIKRTDKKLTYRSKPWAVPPPIKTGVEYLPVEKWTDRKEAEDIFGSPPSYRFMDYNCEQ